MEKRLKISEARKTLFELVEQVTADEEAVVWIEHRDRADQAALVSARHLRSLYRRIEELRRQTEPFQLAGSLLLRGSAEELEKALAELRDEQAEAAAAKFRDL